MWTTNLNLPAGMKDGVLSLPRIWTLKLWLKNRILQASDYRSHKILTGASFFLFANYPSEATCPTQISTISQHLSISISQRYNAAKK
jgi:hypothetical protein